MNSNPLLTKESSAIDFREQEVLKGIGKNSHKNSPHKLSAEVRLKIIEMLAKGYNTSEVNEALKPFKVSVIPSLLTHYRSSPKWLSTLREMRQRYVEAIQDIPSFHKRIRMDRVEKIYASAMAKGDLKLALHTIEQARKEVEGPDGSISNLSLVFNQYNLMSDEELQVRWNDLVKKVHYLKPNKREIEHAEKRDEVEIKRD